MVRISIAYPQTLRKKTPVVRGVTVTCMPELPVLTGEIEALTDVQGLQAPKITVKQRQEKLFVKLDLSGLESWLPELLDSTWFFLVVYYDIFSLEPSELGCTHSTKHVIKVTDDTPFKEWFRQIPPLLVEKVHMHLWEMLDSGAICPSQSASSILMT